ncbi:MAG: helix-turn-helix domain-containing protein [Alistipes sp.]|nr:helix-turn-helix domain-containing protein [Alistipes sp.]
MENVYALPDSVILQRIGSKLKDIRLRRNITQSSLAESSGVSLSTLKKIEGGEIGSFDSLLRLLRTLGKLDVFQQLVDEEPLSPAEYYELVSSAQQKARKRAAGHLDNTKKEKSEW